MRWAGRIVLLVAGLGGGCDLVFAPGKGPGATGGQDGPPGGVDGRMPVDADLADLCPSQSEDLRTVGALADAELWLASPQKTLGRRNIVEIDAASVRHGIFKFDMVGLPTAAPAAIMLTLHYAQSQDECGGTCQSCEPLEMAGVLTAFPMTSAWVEDEVTWERTSNGGRIWNGAGAAGVDFGPVPAVSSHAVATDTPFVYVGEDAVAAWDWIEVNAGTGTRRLSFLVTGGGDAVMVALAQEAAGGSCSPVDEATLEMVFCR